MVAYYTAEKSLGKLINRESRYITLLFLSYGKNHDEFHNAT